MIELECPECHTKLKKLELKIEQWGYYKLQTGKFEIVEDERTYTCGYCSLPIPFKLIAEARDKDDTKENVPE